MSEASKVVRVPREMVVPDRPMIAAYRGEGTATPCRLADKPPHTVIVAVARPEKACGIIKLFS